jgi:phenylacetate-coenzyme A ligase PaaK-like adenylate-forming protein
MGSAIEQLKSLKGTPDPFDIPEAELRPLQIAATQEAFEEKRSKIPTLDKRAREVGVDTIRSLEDIVPLLFSHTNYKSYPIAFLTQKRWKHILQWLSLISSPDYKDVDVEGAVDVDDFLARLWAKDYYVTTSSGTGGKLSMVPKSKSDMYFMKEYTINYRHLERELKPEKQFHFFHFGSTQGTYTATYTASFNEEVFARPDSSYILIDEPMRNSAIMAMAEIRKRIMDNKATPDEIAAFEAQSAEQAKRMNERFDWMVDKLLEVRHEQVWLSAMISQSWELMQRMKAKGVNKAEFGPGSVLTGGGGRKHLKLPADFQEQLNEFYGTSGPRGYGMSEMSWLYPSCKAQRYHVHPFASALVLDQAGERLQAREGIVEGRFAFMDPTTEYRWGGMISGDKVRVDFGPCPCGRKGMTVLNPVQRYTDITGQEDVIQCAGTIDAYIRGSFGDA